MSISRSLPSCLLLWSIAFNAAAFAGDPFTCTYQLRIEEGFLGETPWTADVQVGVGEDLRSYVICCVNESVFFSLIDEQDDIVYCGVIEDGEVELNHKWTSIGDWWRSHRLLGGIAYSLQGLPHEERTTRRLSQAYWIYEECETVIRRLHAVVPTIVDISLQAGYQEPPNELVPFTLAELFTQARIQHAARAREEQPEHESISQRCMVSFFAEKAYFDDGPLEYSLDVVFDDTFTCCFGGIQAGNSFTFIDRDEEIVYKATTEDGEIELRAKYGLHERGVSDFHLADLRNAIEAPVADPGELELALAEFACLTNMTASCMFIEGTDEDRELARYVPFITEVTLQPGVLEWEDEQLPATLDELHEVVSTMEVPEIPWWAQILFSN